MIELLLLLLLGTGDGEQACREHKELVGKCFVVRGRLSAYNGAPTFRIWRIGTTRVLGIAGGEHPIMPKGMTCDFPFDCDVYGEFEVCPLTKEQPRVMQSVCVAGVKKRVVARRRFTP